MTIAADRPASRAVVGVGYEGISIDAFIQRLKHDNVQVLVDVRLTPLSRKRGFSKTKLSEALAQVGIEYRHLKALGNPKDNREAFRSGAIEIGRERFAQHIAGDAGRKALTELADLSRGTRVAVLCFEADEGRCHRQVVIEHVQASAN